MPRFVGGSIDSVTIAGRAFAVTAAAEVNVRPGGRDQRRERYGDGSSRNVWSPQGWSIEGLIIASDLDNDDPGFLQALDEDAPISLTLVSGHVYDGNGSIVGTVEHNAMSSTIPLALGGDGVLQLTQPSEGGVLGAFLDAVGDLF